VQYNSNVPLKAVFYNGQFWNWLVHQNAELSTSYVGEQALGGIDVKNVQKKIKNVKKRKKRNKNKKRLKTLDKKRSSPIHNA